MTENETFLEKQEADEDRELNDFLAGKIDRWYNLEASIDPLLTNGAIARRRHGRLEVMWLEFDWEGTKSEWQLVEIPFSQPTREYISAVLDAMKKAGLCK